jgi:predicted nucleic acid-binding protein
MGSLTVVYDTNVLISGIGWSGRPWGCLQLALIRDVEMVTSEEAL